MYVNIYTYLLYICGNGVFKTMPIYQTNNYTLLQIKEKKLHRKI